MDLTYNDSESFIFFDSVRHGLLGEFDIISKLREISNSYDLEYLLALNKDLSIYLFTEKDEMESRFKPEEIAKLISQRKLNGLKVPYEKPANGKIKELNNQINKEKRIDKETLLFPYEFTPLYKLQRKIEDKIKEQNNKDLPESRIKKINWDFSELEIVELGKALCEMKKPVGASEKEVIQALGTFFNLNINETLKTKRLETIRKRKETPDFLEKLSAYLSTWGKK